MSCLKELIIVLMKLIADTPTTLSALVSTISSTTFVTIPVLDSTVGIVLVTVVRTPLLGLPLPLNLLLRPLLLSGSASKSPRAIPENLLVSITSSVCLVIIGAPAHVCCQSFHTVPTSTPANIASKLPS